MSYKKYLPRPEMIPAIVFFGGLGAFVVAKAFPKLTAWVSATTPAVQKTTP